MDCLGLISIGCLHFFVSHGPEGRSSRGSKNSANRGNVIAVDNTNDKMTRPSFFRRDLFSAPISRRARKVIAAERAAAAKLAASNEAEVKTEDTIAKEKIRNGRALASQVAGVRSCF